MIKGGDGWANASNNEDQIRAWWTRWPEANVAVACGLSNLAVLDVDYGLEDDAAALAWLAAVGLPPTYVVRTGRRPEMGLQFYFEGAIPDVGEFHLAGCSGQIKSLGGYVMSAGCVHPVSKQTYVVKNPAPLARTPDIVRALKELRINNLYM
jgi:hypothetical protein